MESLARLQNDMKTAMKSGQKDRLTVIRMLISDVKNIDLASKPTTAEQAVDAYARKLRKSIEEYEKLNRTPEVQTLQAELAVVEEYAPKRATLDETRQLVEEFLRQNSFTEKQAGQAMGTFMKQHGSRVEAQQANALIRQALAGK